VKVFAVSGPAVRRVIGLTAFVLAKAILSPASMVSPEVPVMTMAVPDWFAPVTVTVLAQVPAVCA
jgi:hypothetical protein